MYTSKALLPARARLKVRVFFKFQDHIPAYPDLESRSHVEIGYSQSVNMARHYKQAFNEAILNAFYKLFSRVGGYFRTGESIHDFCQRIEIMSHQFDYFEDRLYSYKREKDRNKHYTYVIRRKGKIYNRVKGKYVPSRNRKGYKNIESNIT